MSTTSHKRQFARADVRCGVAWDHRQIEGEEGEIFDFSEWGIFLHPKWGIPESLTVGDVVWGAFLLGSERHVFAATVRWRGWSERHGRDGIGLEFDRSSLEDADFSAFLEHYRVGEETLD